MRYDIIGDIHGYAEHLRRLLQELGYREVGGHYQHPESDRKVIFVGDFIDRGPKIRETLSIVKAMVDNGSAHAVMGNHEYNAICFHTNVKGTDDKWLRSRNDRNIKQHMMTLCQFNAFEEEWQGYLNWFMGLPLFHEIDGIRIVHAAWVKNDIKKIKKWTDNSAKLNEDLLHKSAEKGTEEYHAVENILKGPEVALPGNKIFTDKDGIPRKEIRVKWWESAVGKTYEAMLFPENDVDFGDLAIAAEEVKTLEIYTDVIPVFFGHYWLNNHTPRSQTDFVACLDYSVAKEGKLVAYCWDGEKSVNNYNFIFVS